MKTLITILTVLLFVAGCAQAPIITPEPVIESTLAPGCIQSETADHSYQSAIDPKVIFETWTEIPELQKGGFMLMEISFRNPDIDSDIPAALLVRQAGNVIGFSYLENGEPKMFLYDSETNCYLEGEITEEYRKEFLTDLMLILGATGV